MTVRTLVISSGLTGGYKSTAARLDLTQFWRYGLSHTAAVAGWLAKKVASTATKSSPWA